MSSLGSITCPGSTGMISADIGTPLRWRKGSEETFYFTTRCYKNYRVLNCIFDGKVLVGHLQS